MRRQRRLDPTARQADDPAKVRVADLAGEDHLQLEPVAEEGQRLVEVGHREARVVRTDDDRHGLLSAGRSWESRALLLYQIRQRVAIRGARNRSLTWQRLKETVQRPRRSGVDTQRSGVIAFPRWLRTLTTFRREIPVKNKPIPPAPSAKKPAKTSRQTEVAKPFLKQHGTALIVGSLAVVVVTGLTIWAFSSDDPFLEHVREARRELGRKDVQKELKLTEEQLEKLKEVDEARNNAVSAKDEWTLSQADRDDMRNRATFKGLTKALTAPQLTRLKQILIQEARQALLERRGRSARAEPEQCAKAGTRGNPEGIRKGAQ